MEIKVFFSGSNSSPQLVASLPKRLLVHRSLHAETDSLHDYGWTLEGLHGRDSGPEYNVMIHDCANESHCGSGNTVCSATNLYKLTKYQKELTFLVRTVVSAAQSGTPIDECSITMEIPDKI